MTTATRLHTPWRFNVDEYHRMAEVGILPEDARVELIEGEIVAMSPIGNRHLACVDRLTDMLTEALRPRAIVRVQGSIRLDGRSEPEPDLAILRRRADFYASGMPLIADILLVIEVMDSSADYDRTTKLGLYARAKIAEVWLVDLNGEVIEVHRKPAEEGRYAESVTRSRGESVAPEAFPDAEFTVDSILG